MTWDCCTERAACDPGTGAARSAIERCRPLYADLCARVAAYVRNGEQFVVLGGDHSCAIGTWSGATGALRPRGPLGLIWIDAHLDAHTFETTPSGYLHGMPVAALLGAGDPALTRIHDPAAKLSPDKLVLIGDRSHEPAEQELLERLGVRIVTMAEVRARGLTRVLGEALAVVRDGTAGFGISLDLDALDPRDAPAVGTPVADGIRGADLAGALHGIAGEPALVGIEIAEFNPSLDQGRRTARLIEALLTSSLDGSDHASPHRAGSRLLRA